MPARGWLKTNPGDASGKHEDRLRINPPTIYPMFFDPPPDKKIPRADGAEDFAGRRG